MRRACIFWAGLRCSTWLLLGAGVWNSLNYTVAVLIVTCPCALGLAVPVVQVVATGRLLRRGILVKSADGLERLAEADTVVFDKTGTLTLGRLELANRAGVRDAQLAVAASLARSSRHPLSQALVRAAGLSVAHTVEDVREQPGMGLEGRIDGRSVRLGNRDWIGVTGESDESHMGSELWFRHGEEAPVRFLFTDEVRTDARETVNRLKEMGFAVILLSGDREGPVTAVAHELGIADYQWGARPDAKIARLKELGASGACILMVGDGLNDAPALRAAHVSMSPASATDISQIAADYVFQGKALAPVLDAIAVARKARRLVYENFGLALAYNAVAIPLAMAGYVTPLIAAVAMSSSSITVTLNSLRLNLRDTKGGY
ncbi:MAG: HAD-IC family P-type ATPase [Parvibaculaceae bacterium]|nr:HAD-IC family P-type ATPase [Parvibaculaceae bacterium]